MPIIYANSDDGVVTSLNAVANTARNAATGTSVGTTSMIDQVGFEFNGNYVFRRGFFRFDTRAITTPPSSATIYIYFNTPVAGDYILVKAESDTFAGGLTTGNFGSIVGRPATGTYSGNVTDYSSNFTPSITAFQSISLNSNALADIGTSSTTFNVCILNHVYDYLNTAVNPGITSQAQMIFNDFPGTTFDIYLDYVEGTGGGRSSVSGATATRSELRASKEITAQLDAGTDYEVKLVNNLKSQVYFNFESAEGKQLFDSASIRTTTSDSGSNVVGFVSESTHASFILESESTSSFFISSSTHHIIGNTFKVVATNPEIININDTTASGSIVGVDMEFLS